METLTLAAPEVIPAITTTEYRVARIMLDPEQAEISIHYRGTNGERRELRYSGDDATTKMRALNKANLSLKSLNTRLLELLATDGQRAGTVTGTPD